MKKTLKRSLSLITCLALLLTVLWVPPLRASAADTAGTIQLNIEGSQGNIFSGAVSFTNGQTVDDILQKLDADHVIDLTDNDGYISQIGTDQQTDDWSKYWAFYINDTFSDKGVSQVTAHNGDDIILAYLGYCSSFSTSYPVVSLSSSCPKPGDTVIVKVTNLFTGMGIKGVTVKLGTQTATTPDVADTDPSSGIVTFTAPVAGSYNIDVSKVLSSPVTEGTTTYDMGFPMVVHRSIPLTVADTAPADRTVGTADTDRVIDLGASTVSSVNILGGSAVTLNLNGSTVPSALTTTYHNSYKTFTASFPAGTAVSGPTGWGNALSIGPGSVTTVPGGVVTLAAAVGSTGYNLSLSGYARIALLGQTGQMPGTFDESNNFHPITTRLSSDAVPDGFSGSDACYDDGHDLIIYTKHLSTFVAYTPAVAPTDLASAISGAAASLTASGSRDYWAAFALARSGNTVPAGFLTDTAQTVHDNGGDFDSAASLAMTVIGLRAAGANPLNFNGVNLVEKLYNFGNIEGTGVNGPIFALLALDSGNYTVPAGAKWSTASLVTKILSYQASDGGFSLASGGTSDSDITAMAITALAPHRTETGVGTAIDGAVTYLSTKFKAANGLIPAGGSEISSESAAWAIIALCSAGVDPKQDTRFISGSSSLYDNLMSFRLSDGSFRDRLSATGGDTMATEQALMALTAYRLYTNGSARLFDLTGTADGITSVAVSTGDSTPNPKTGGTAPVSELVAIPCMLALIAAASVQKKRSR